MNPHLHPIFQKLMPAMPEAYTGNPHMTKLLGLRRDLNAAGLDLHMENYMCCAHRLDTVANELLELAKRIRSEQEQSV